MAEANVGHSLIRQNIYAALHVRLRGSGCRTFGLGAGVETLNGAIRYPDALVTCTKVAFTDRVIPGVIVVFEVLSPTSGAVDRIINVREYAAVASIRRYVIVESSAIGLTVLERHAADESWRAAALIKDDSLRMPVVGIEIPVAEFYEDIIFTDEDKPAE